MENKQIIAWTIFLVSALAFFTAIFFYIEYFKKKSKNPNDPSLKKYAIIGWTCFGIFFLTFVYLILSMRYTHL